MVGMINNPLFLCRLYDVDELCLFLYDLVDFSIILFYNCICDRDSKQNNTMMM